MIKNLTLKESGRRFSIWRLWLVLLCATTPCTAQTVIPDARDDNFELIDGWRVYGCWDISQIIGGVRGSNLYLSASIYWIPSGCPLAFIFSLDVDQDSGTGLESGPFAGADYLVVFNELWNPERARIRSVTTAPDADPIQGEVPVTFHGRNIEVIVPLAMVGGGSGLMNFGARLATAVDANSVSLPDFVPMGGPTSYIVLLSIRQVGPNVRLSWPAAVSEFGEFTLQTATVLTPQPDWDYLFRDPTIEGEEAVVLEPITAQTRYYRLERTFP